ncbi:MAG: UbiA prenyltransferase family protein [bacterium]|nr:UbiA prenyltransferase family protein [bacterium]
MTMSFITLLRPLHWVKNLLVFVPIFFAREIFMADRMMAAFYAFLAFSLTASAVYIINDIVDRQHDAQHPIKRLRPIASGAVSITQAVMLLVILLAGGAILVYFLSPQLAVIIGAYLLLNLLYSFYLKHWPIFDIVLISSLYLLRVVGGGVASQTHISTWLILCTVFISLFLIVGKRRVEFSQLHRRKVLGLYSGELLDHLFGIAAGLTIISYGLYTILGVNSELAVYSIFLVLIGIFRYLLITYRSAVAEYPERVLWSDKIISGSVLAWLIFMYFIFY